MNGTRLLASLLLALSLGCSSDDIDSDAEARLAYLGFDQAIERALGLGFDGFNSASSANISTQSGDGDELGTMAIDGQVDQGSSDNKNMRLLVTLVEYSDGPVDDIETGDLEAFELVYDTAPDAPLTLDISLRDIPDGTFTGSLAGTAVLTGALDAEATFALTLSGGLTPDAGSSGGVVREPGTLVVTGTVTSSDGSFTVDIGD